MSGINPYLRQLVFLLYAGTVYGAEPGATAVTTTSLIEAYNQAECCVFINQLDIIKLEKGKKLELDLTASGKLLQLSTGPSYAALIEIPVSKRDESYTISAPIIQNGDELHAFFPYAALLDADLNLIGSSRLTHIAFAGKVIILQPTPYLYANIEIGPNDSKEKAPKYLLVHTRAKHFTSIPAEELARTERKIQGGEVSLKFSDAVEPTYRQTVYGLPGSVIKIEHNNGLF